MKQFIFFIFHCFLLISVFAFLHEATHVVILEYYGIDDWEVIFSWKGIGIKHYGECVDGCLLAHSINEVIGYNVMPLLLLIQISLMLRYL